MILLDKYGDMVGKFKLENIIAIHCYDDNSNSIFRMKDKMSKSDKIYEVYYLIKKRSKSSTCEKTFLICPASDINEELDNNFNVIETLNAVLYINHLTEINTNEVRDEEIGVIYIKKNNEKLTINYGLKDVNHLGFYDCKYQFKLI